MIANGRTVRFRGLPVAQGSNLMLVPLGPVSDAIGATANVARGARTVAIMRGEAYMTFDIVPNSPPRAADDAAGWRSTMVPLRFVSDALGGSVRFVPASQRQDGIEMVYLDLPQWPPAAQAANPGYASGSGTPLADSAAAADAQPRVQEADEVAVPGGTVDKSDYAAYNLELLNEYRTRAGVPPLVMDDELAAFATRGTAELMSDHLCHQHFKASDVFSHGFRGSAGENQGDPRGWSPQPARSAIEQILLAMYNEGPGGGHYENMMNPRFRRVGVGLLQDGSGRLYLTNDFSQ
jgi:uncharacterized protein YkwD